LGPEGQFSDTIDGRLFNPGHAIEAGWFFVEEATRSENHELEGQAIAIIRRSFTFGWDGVHGGLFYFLDCKGYERPELEWSMKL